MEAWISRYSGEVGRDMDRYYRQLAIVREGDRQYPIAGYPVADLNGDIVPLEPAPPQWNDLVPTLGAALALGEDQGHVELAGGGDSDATVASSTDRIGFLTDEEEEKLLKEANLRTYTDWNQRREDNRAEMEVEMERPLEFSIKNSLRLQWTRAQAKDPECHRILAKVGDSQMEVFFKKTGLGRREQGLAPKIYEEYRKAEDGLLERKAATE